MALGIRCFRLLHPAFCSYHAALTRSVSEVSMKTVSERQHDRRQYSAYPAVPVRHFATKKAKGRWSFPPSHPFLMFGRDLRDVLNFFPFLVRNVISDSHRPTVLESRACFVTAIPH